MENVPQVKLGIVAVSRDCFPKTLSENRRKNVVKAFAEKYGEIFESQTIVENETDALKALEEVNAAGVNALVVFLGNFGPESSETILAQRFAGPVMFVAAAEETGEDLYDGRGDAYCGLLNASYNLKLRNINAYIPAEPVGDAEEIADKINAFIPIARAIIGVSSLKIITFGPRPQDFLACNAPIKQLFNLGVEIEENSELDLLCAYEEHNGDPRIEEVAADMKAELPDCCAEPALTAKFAQLEITLLDWARDHKGSREYVVFANKCWPSFQHKFGFLPCFNNSRLSARGIPVACEVDIYGALSEYIGMCVSDDIVTLLDINNTVPKDMYNAEIAGKYDYRLNDVFMGFHCGNTCTKKLCSSKLGYNMIMARTAGVEISTGTVNGNILPGEVTVYRLQGTAEGGIRAYVAEGDILPVDCKSFGGIGVIAIDEMNRFYRYALLEKAFPHHAAVAFGKQGAAMFEVLKYLGVKDIEFNRPKGNMYATENPFNC